MTSRIFTVRINLDEMAAGLAHLGTDKQRSAWLRGFQAGSRGFPSEGPEGSPAAIGHALGASCYAEATALQAMQADKGKLSAEARARNRKATAVEPRFQPEGNRGSTAAPTGTPTAGQPIQISSNPERENPASPSSSEVSPREDYPATTTTAPPGHVDEVRQATDRFRVQAANPSKVRAALRGTDVRDLAKAFGANPTYPEWESVANGLTLRTFAAIMGWAAQADPPEAIRAPSRFIHARERWEDLGVKERGVIGRRVLAAYGVELPEPPAKEASA